MPLRTSRTRRAAIRLGAVTLTALALVAVAGPASADTPVSWPDAEPMSTLEALLVFVGIPAGLFALIALLVVAPSLARGPRYRPGVTWLAPSEQFGARTPLPAPTDADAADSQGSEAFTVDQRRSIDRAIAYAEKASELTYSVYVGAAHDRARSHAEHLHRDLPDPTSSVLVLVDPATREIEIVVGTQARARVDEQSAGLAVLAMQSAFGAGDLAGGIVAGLQLLGDHARRPASLHTDSP
ncbi:MAG: DUF5130 family protein [Nocardioidaceae bacterium]